MDGPEGLGVEFFVPMMVHNHSDSRSKVGLLGTQRVVDDKNQLQPALGMNKDKLKLTCTT